MQAVRGTLEKVQEIFEKSFQEIKKIEEYKNWRKSPYSSLNYVYIYNEEKESVILLKLEPSKSNPIYWMWNLENDSVERFLSEFGILFYKKFYFGKENEDNLLRWQEIYSSIINQENEKIQKKGRV